MQTIVNAVLMSGKNVLLARRSPHRKAYPDCWSFPGGHLQGSETLEEALIREITEEIGTIPLKYCLIAEIISDRSASTDPATFHIYAVEEWEGNPTIRDKEHTELRWFSLYEAELLNDLALDEYRPLFASLRTRATQVS